MGLHADFSPLTCSLFLLLPSFLLNTERGNSGQCPGQDGELLSMARFPCLPLARPSPLVAPSSFQITPAHHLLSVARDKVGRGSSAPSVFAGRCLSRHAAHSFCHICVLHQLTAHTDVSASVCHYAHSGDTRRSKAPFLPPRFSGIKIPLESPSHLKSLLSSSSSPSTIDKSERKVKSLSGVRLFATPWTVAYRLLCSWNFPGNSPGVDCHFLLQGIFPTQGSNPGLPRCRQTLYCLSQKDSLKPLPNLQCSVWNIVKTL